MKHRITIEVDVDQLNKGLIETGGGEDIFGLCFVLDGTDESNTDAPEQREIMGVKIINVEIIS